MAKIANPRQKNGMKIIVTSVLVADQAKALKFYTKGLGFVKKTDLPAGKYRWLTVVSPDARDGVELVLEPAALKESRTYQKALFKMGIPATVFGVDDIAKEFKRLKRRGVKFSQEPTAMGPVTAAVFADTCGHHLMICQK